MPMPNASRAAGLLLGLMVLMGPVVAVGLIGAIPANAEPRVGSALPMSRAMQTPSPSPTPIGQTLPSPIRGLAPFGLVIGILLVGGVSVLYGRRSQ